MDDDGMYLLCGNATGSQKCPDGYVCLKDRGQKFVLLKLIQII